MPQRDAPTPPHDPQTIIDDQARRIRQLEEDLRRSEAERQRLRRENDKLKDELEAAPSIARRRRSPAARASRSRAGRVARPAPRTACGPAVACPGRSMRPTAALPPQCPHCAGAVRRVRVAPQYQEELPVQRPLVRRFDVRLGRLLERTPSRRVAIARFQAHLIVEYDAIFSFLIDPVLEATNWRAEQALRPAVVTRKMCGGGNRTVRGAQSQQVLASVLRTADQRGLDVTDVFVPLLAAPEPIVPPSLRTPPAIH